jgi:hypothetical protein
MSLSFGIKLEAGITIGVGLSAGTITFGDRCTLQYINSKWFCIGQNGVAFA